MTQGEAVRIVALLDMAEARLGQCCEEEGWNVKDNGKIGNLIALIKQVRRPYQRVGYPPEPKAPRK